MSVSNGPAFVVVRYNVAQPDFSDLGCFTINFGQQPPLVKDCCQVKHHNEVMTRRLLVMSSTVFMIYSVMYFLYVF